MAFEARVHSPTADEPAHLASGWSHWRFGQFDLYRVNPPLVRLLASVPLIVGGTSLTVETYRDVPGSRSEFSMGSAFLQQNGFDAIRQLTRARWMCLPLVLWGAYVCYRWSRGLYGEHAGLLAAALWCFSPSILGHGQLITPDVSAASLGVTAAYCYWNWLRESSWQSALSAGAALGFALLTKFTLIVLIPLSLVVWLVWHHASLSHSRKELQQLIAIFAISLFVIHAGYGFEKSFIPLGDFRFVSRSLSGQRDLQPGESTNRFANSWIGCMPVPLPENYLLGIDAQREDFEAGKWSYMRGEWQWRGWWHYYAYAMLVKEPLALWALLAMALICTPRMTVSVRNELMLVLPMVGILLLVSSERGFSHHPRYVLPAYPFLFIWVSRIAAIARYQPEEQAGRVNGSVTTTRLRYLNRNRVVLALVAWYVTSSLSVYPHSLSYFNELAGGPLGGPRCLLASSSDWGQNLVYLTRWLDEHPEIDEPRLAWHVDLVDPKYFQLDFPQPPAQAALQHFNEGDLPMWCLVSVNELYASHRKYAYLRDLRPDAMIGYSIYAYRLDDKKLRSILR